MAMLEQDELSHFQPVPPDDLSHFKPMVSAQPPASPQGQFSRLWNMAKEDILDPKTQQLMLASGLAGSMLPPGNIPGAIGGALLVPATNLFSRAFHEQLQEARQPQDRERLAWLDQLMVTGATALAPFAAGAAAKLFSTERELAQLRATRPPSLRTDPLEPPSASKPIPIPSPKMEAQQLPLIEQKELAGGGSIPVEIPKAYAKSEAPFVEPLPYAIQPPGPTEDVSKLFPLTKGKQLPLPMTVTGPRSSKPPLFPTHPQAGPTVEIDPFLIDPEATDTFPHMVDVPIIDKITNTAQRATSSAISTLSQTGPRGQQLAALADHILKFRDQATSQNMNEWVELATHLYGPAPRSVKGTLLARKHPTTPLGLQDIVNIPDDELHALVDLHSSGGSWDIGHLNKGAQDRVMRLWREGWPIATGRASDLVYRQKIPVTNSITGETYPMKEPHSFWPHQIKTGIQTSNFNDTVMRRVWETQYKDSMTYLEFKTHILDHRMPDALTKLAPPSRFMGVEEARSFDEVAVAKKIQSTPSKVLEGMGIDIDPLRTLTRYNMGAYQRAKVAENEETWVKLQDDWFNATGGHKAAESWLINFNRHFAGKSFTNDLVDSIKDGVTQMKAGLNLILLQRSVIPNINQFSYASSMHKVGAQADYFLQGILKNQINEVDLDRMVKESGVLIPAIQQEMAIGTRWLEKLSAVQLRATRTTSLDKLQRYITASQSAFHLRWVGRNLLAHPTDTGAKRYAVESGVNPDELYKAMVEFKEPTAELYERSMQTWSNRLQGVPSIQNRPLGSLRDDLAGRVFWHLKGQVMSNTTAAKEMILNAPTVAEGFARASRFLPLTTLTGMLTRPISLALTVGAGIEAQREIKKRLGKWHNFAIESFLYGAGTTYTDLVLQTIRAHDGPEALLFQLGPAPAVAGSLLDIALRDVKKGDMSRVAERLARYVPFTPLSPSVFIEPRSKKHDPTNLNTSHK